MSNIFYTRSLAKKNITIPPAAIKITAKRKKLAPKR